MLESSHVSVPVMMSGLVLSNVFAISARFPTTERKLTFSTLRGRLRCLPCWLDRVGVEEWSGLNSLSASGTDMVLEVHGDSWPTPCRSNNVALWFWFAHITQCHEMSESFRSLRYVWEPMFWHEAWNHAPQDSHATPLSPQSTDLSQTPQGTLDASASIVWSVITMSSPCAPSRGWRQLFHGWWPG